MSLDNIYFLSATNKTCDNLKTLRHIQVCFIMLSLTIILFLGHPVADPGNNCGILNGAVQYSWQSSKCNKRLGYICYSERPVTPPTGGEEKYSLNSYFIQAYHWLPYKYFGFD